ncbi:MAG: hypothetical protein NTW66_03615 [Candidatus Magasanikbacteria bacterium]|nr:hypothetical protein [Candidatus Magasanikbacteria bacterium]
MRRYIRSIFYIVLILFIFTLHVAAANLFPFPLNRLNIILISAMWLLIFNKQNKIVFVFLLSLISELFLSTPFGLNTAALLISAAALEWVLLNLLTNRFFTMVFLAGLFGTFLFKASFFSIFLLMKIFGLAEISMNQSVLLSSLIEIVVNAGALTLIYIISLLFVKRLNPKYIVDR